MNGRIVRLGYSPRFRFDVEKRQIEFLDGPEAVATGLNILFKQHLAHNVVKRYRGRRFSKSPDSPRPNEFVDDVRPLFRWDGPSFSAVGTWTVRTYSRDWTGTRTPNFAKKKAEGKLPVNPHHVKIWVRRDAGSFFHEDWLDLPGYGTGRFEPFSYRFGTSDNNRETDIVHSTEMRNVAIRRLRDKAIGETANLAESFVTLNQTTRMIGNLFYRIGSSVMNLKRGNIPGSIRDLFGSKPPKFRRNGGPSATKDLAGNWLELQYGWKPVLMDIQFLLEKFKAFSAEDFPVHVVESSATHRIGEGGELKPNAGSEATVIGGWSKLTTTRTSFGIRFKVQDQFRALLSQSGFTNPISLLWELLPFSFVGDWALPIGPYLESLDSWGGLVLLDGWETNFSRKIQVFQTNYDGYAYPVPRTPPNRHTTIQGFYRSEAILLDRVKLTSFPTMDLPTLKNPFSVGHALNGVALMVQLFKR